MRPPPAQFQLEEEWVGWGAGIAFLPRPAFLSWDANVAFISSCITPAYILHNQMSTLPQSTDKPHSSFPNREKTTPSGSGPRVSFLLATESGSRPCLSSPFQKKKNVPPASLFDPLMFLCNPAFCSGILLLLLNEVCTAEFGK